MTYFCMVSGVDKGEPYILATEDRKYSGYTRKYFNGAPVFERRPELDFYSGKFAVFPDENCVVLASGVQPHISFAIERLASSKDYRKPSNIFEAAQNALRDSVQELDEIVPFEFISNFGSILALGQFEGSVARLYLIKVSDNRELETTMVQGNYCIANSNEVTDRESFLFPSLMISLQLDKVIESVAASHERAALVQPDFVSKEFDAFLLRPDRKPAKLELRKVDGNVRIEDSSEIDEIHIGSRQTTVITSSEPVF